MMHLPKCFHVIMMGGRDIKGKEGDNEVERDSREKEMVNIARIVFSQLLALPKTSFVSTFLHPLSPWEGYFPLGRMLGWC